MHEVANQVALVPALGVRRAPAPGQAERDDGSGLLERVEVGGAERAVLAERDDAGVVPLVRTGGHGDHHVRPGTVTVRVQADRRAPGPAPPGRVEQRAVALILDQPARPRGREHPPAADEAPPRPVR